MHIGRRAVLASPSVDPPIRWEHDRGLGTVWVALPAGVPLGPGNGTFFDVIMSLMS